MRRWISNHISDLNEELRLINKEIRKLVYRRTILKSKIKMFNKVLTKTDEAE